MTQRKRVIPRNNGSPSEELSQPSGAVSLGAPPDYDIPDVPRDVTLLSDRELMKLFTEYVAWQNYAATQLAEAEIEEAKADAAVRYEEAMLMTSAPLTAKVTVTRANAIIGANMQAIKDRAMNAYALRKMTAVVYANCERVVALISRELTRRVGREGPERRNSRWNP